MKGSQTWQCAVLCWRERNSYARSGVTTEGEIHLLSDQNQWAHLEYVQWNRTHTSEDHGNEGSFFVRDWNNFFCLYNHSPACLGMAFPSFLVKQLYHCDSVVISRLWEQGIPREGEDDCWVGYAGPEAKGSNLTTGLTLLWARNPFRGNFKHWQVSRKEASKQINQGKEILLPNWQKESW